MFVSKPISKIPYDVCIIHLNDARYYPFFQRQAEAIVEKGLRVALVSWEKNAGESDPKWPGIDVYPICIFAPSISGKLFFIRYMITLTFVLLRLRAKLYEAVDPPALIPARMAAFVNKARYVYFSLEYFKGVDTLVSRPVTRLMWYIIERIGICKAVSVAAVCETTEQLLKREFKLTHTTTILNVPNKAEYAPTGDGRLRKRIGLAPNIPLAVYKGEISEGRGLMQFVVAMQSFPQLNFACIGEGSYAQTLREKAQTLGCHNRLHFIDPVPSSEFVHYLKDADIGHVIHDVIGVNMMVTLPSKLFDYIHAGIPVIASDGPEIASVVRQWDVGWVVSPFRQDTIIAALGDFMEAYPHLDKYKINCAAAAEIFCWEKEKLRYGTFIDDALSK